MNFNSRLEAIRKDMDAQGIDLLLAFHDGVHFIEKQNAIMVLAGFKSMGECVVALTRGGEGSLLVAPAWDAPRAADFAPHLKAIGTDDMLAALASEVKRHGVPAERTAVVGLQWMAFGFERRARAFLGAVKAFDGPLFLQARCKTDEELARAQRATQIAEKGWENTLGFIRPGMREDELAVELRWQMKALGAEDNFLMLSSDKHNYAVQPSSGRRFSSGDLIMGELTPSFEGQMSQICRTVSVGPASDTIREGYALLVRAMESGMKAARPGSTMGDVCKAINAVLEAKGYGEYCHPPHIRRRGHGLGFSCNHPGDVAPDNAMPLEPGMFFVLHPNQYLPETGYMMCGEPMLITPEGSRHLTQRTAFLAETPL